MDVLIAIAHILGSIITLFTFGIVVFLIAGWEASRNQKQVADETSVALGVSIEDLDSEELAPRILQYSADKFSSELFRNRFSDLCGIVRTIWIWIGNIAQIVFLLAIIWYTITESSGNAVYAWFVISIAIIFWLVSVVFSFACKLFTGRYPGQAKEARRATAEWIENNSKLLKQHKD